MTFDARTPASLQVGCGGTSSDWEIVRSVQDPGDGSVRSTGAESDSCLMVPMKPAASGMVTALLTPEDGAVGFVLRYRGPGEHLRLELDLAKGKATAIQVVDGVQDRLGGVDLAPMTGGAHRVAGVFDASSVELFLNGQRLLRVEAPPTPAGLVGLLARGSALAEFDDVAFLPIADQAAPRVDPFAPGRATVGSQLDISLRCLNGECSFTVRPNRLPPGLVLRDDGRLTGVPRLPGEYRFEVAARMIGTGAASRAESILRVSATAWTRFPVNVESRTRRDLAVLYTPDDIGPDVTMKMLGHPDQLLFRLHQDHPSLKVTIMGCPANRYVAWAGAVPSSAQASQVWRTLALDPAYDWVDMGGHGYSHSPDGDVNLDHHEFSTTQTGCNVDHAGLGSSAYCRHRLGLARGVFEALGIRKDLTTVMRFPGMSDSPEALEAASASGFVTILGSRHAGEAGREWWVPCRDGEILEIENSTMKSCFGPLKSLEDALAAGEVTPEALPADTRFLESVRRGSEYVDLMVAQGGILNLFDHYWETFQQFGGATPRYLVMDAVLKDIESRYRERVWYPSARDLGLWLDARRFSRVDWREIDQGLLLTLRSPRDWKRLGLSGLEQASLVVRLPVGFTGVSSVAIKPEGGAFAPLPAASWWVEPGIVVVSFPFRGDLQLLIRPEELFGSD